MHIDYQFELVRLHDWQIRRLRAFEDATDINANLTVTIDYVGPIAHQTPDFGVVTQCVRRWEVMECRQLCQLDAPAVKKRACRNENRIRPLATKGFESTIDLR